ncbi:MAG TPA: hypothetical protein VLF60_04820 [Candidatus Saccharimonadales bacterium]|nr:hypothetical protein [Candidatus Saccharimonadales bacterium]
MKRWLQQLEEPIKTAGSIVEKKLMHDFARRFGLVYLGNISAQNDEYELVRGVTLHTHHHDRHFIIGNYKGYDVTALQRHVDLTHPQHGTNHYKWSILQIDLHHRQVPHVLVTAHHHDQLFFDNVQIKLANFQQLSPELIPHQSFAHNFRVFSVADGLDEIPSILSPEIMTAMTQHFKGFDVEMFDDQLIVYTSQSRVTLLLMQELLREALWLAKHLDAAMLQHTDIPQDGPEA